MKLTGIVPAMAAAKKWCRWVIADGYNPNFHWAPVVFTTSEGYICLEVQPPFGCLFLLNLEFCSSQSSGNQQQMGV